LGIFFGLIFSGTKFPIGKGVSLVAVTYHASKQTNETEMWNPRGGVS
jgi:hypothetical protein